MESIDLFDRTLFNVDQIALILAADHQQKLAEQTGLKFRTFDNLRASVIAYTNWYDYVIEKS
jgi:hypothetical protein